MKIILRLVIFLATAVFVLLLPIYFLLWQQTIIVKTVITTQNIEVLNEGQLIELTKQTLNFLLNKSQLPNIFSSNEVVHMADVAALVKQGFYVLVIVFFILILLYIFFKFLGSPEVFYKLFRSGAIFSMILLFVLALLILIDFTVNFLYFHNIFFPQGNFIFPEDSLLIQIFPERFFKEIMIYIFMGAVFTAGVIITLATYKLRDK
jgi:integral membrane protein (TIGR01906 family)